MKSSVRGSLFLVFVVAALLSACAGGPRMVKAEQELKAPPDKALIVFLTPMVVGGQVQLWDGEKFIGFSQPRTIFSYVAKPGEHVFLMRDENWQILKGRVGAGKTYYIKLEMRVGVGYYTSGTRVSVEVLNPGDRRIKEWKQTLVPIQLADESKAASFEKKYNRHVSKAMSNVESGKLHFIRLNP